MAGVLDAIRRTPALISSGVSRQVQRVRYGDACIRIDTSRDVSVVLNMSETHRACRHSGGRRMTADPFVGAATIVPPGSPTNVEISGTARVLMLQLPWASVRAVAEADGRDADRVALQPRFAFDDPVLAHLLYAAAGVPDGAPEPIEPIVHRLMDAHAVTSKPIRLAIGGLTPAKLRRVRDRIEAELETPPTLTDLAGEAGLSRFHFAREFRRVAGQSPHAYVLRRQLDRATMLLADQNLSVTDVAVASGFAHAAHLARHLRRRTGLSPVDFRSRVVP